ncbi:hypothetical protein AAIB46_35225 [Streptomyces sp. 35M1]|uniref:hypothetical protein n=1 Tax=Streptomyces sp. 35M1 TaxID=3142978 RepID=UPI003990B92B
MITDVATNAATTHDSKILPGIHTRLACRGLLPADDDAVGRQVLHGLLCPVGLLVVDADQSESDFGDLVPGFGFLHAES